MLYLILLIIFLINSLEFEQWAEFQNKHYSKGEILRRKAIFNNNKKYVNKFNKEEHEYKISLEGPFSDLTNNEYQNILMEPYEVKLPNKEEIEKIEKDINIIEAPITVDWRTKTTTIKNQGSCGGCYAFGALGALEGRLIIEGKATNTINLSEQQIIDCSGTNGNLACKGGRPDWTYNYIKTIGGVMKENDYPYTAKKGTCKVNKNKFVASCTGFGRTTKGSENALLNEVAKGHVVINIDSSKQTFQLYKSGIYNDPSCSSTKLNHAVIAVGYGIQNNIPYWLVKNSWGTSWGDKGYIKMIRNANNRCGVATDTAYPLNPKLVSSINPNN